MYPAETHRSVSRSIGSVILYFSFLTSGVRVAIWRCLSNISCWFRSRLFDMTTSPLFHGLHDRLFSSDGTVEWQCAIELGKEMYAVLVARNFDLTCTRDVHKVSKACSF